MILFPAIDIHQGKCVRLTKGDFSTAEQVAADPIETARQFQAAGAEWIHMVDLDGAKTAEPVNSSIFLEVAKKTGCKVQLGGGIRSIETVRYYLENGISRVILGSAAIQNPKLVEQAIWEFGEQIAVGIDARNGRVAVSGWYDDSDVDFLELAHRMEDLGVRTFIFTDISKDGTLEGPNFLQLIKLNNAVQANIIASGGVSNLQDVIRCKAAKLYGCICGKALYKGTLDLKEAVEAVKKTEGRKPC